MKDGTWRTDDDRFVAVPGAYMGTTTKWILQDTVEGKRYRNRTLDGCREDIRGILDEEAR